MSVTVPPSLKLSGNSSSCVTSITASNVINSVTLTNHGVGYTSQPAISTNITLNTYTPCSTLITLTDSNSNPVLEISNDGEIKFNGLPSKAADQFIKSLCSSIDIVTAGKLALGKTYRKAIDKCLKQARSMTKEEYIAALEKELKTRTSKAVLLSLKDTDE